MIWSLHCKLHVEFSELTEEHTTKLYQKKKTRTTERILNYNVTFSEEPWRRRREKYIVLRAWIFSQIEWQARERKQGCQRVSSDSEFTEMQAYSHNLPWPVIAGLQPQVHITMADANLRLIYVKWDKPTWKWALYADIFALLKSLQGWMRLKSKWDWTEIYCSET